MRKSLTLLSTITILLFMVSIAKADNASQYIKLVKRIDAPPYSTHSHCSINGGKRVFVENKHPSKIIELNIDRYFDGLRQPGRSMIALAPGHEYALGCSIAMKSPQSWKLISAAFSDKQQAMADYGIIY